MAKLRKSSVEVSLFPFLSILACTIGILVMILCSVIISQINPEGIEKVEKEKRENEENIKKLDGIELLKREVIEKLKMLKQELAKKIDSTGQVDILQAEIASRQKVKETLLDGVNKAKTLNEALAIKENEKNELLASQEEKKKLHGLIRAAIKKEKERLYRRLKIVGTGGGSLGSGMNITYVECSKKGLMVIGDEEVHIAKGSLSKNKDWQNLIKKNSAKPKNILVFLLRPSYGAIQSYYEAKSILDKYYRYVDNAVNNSKIALVSYEPIAVGGR